MPCNSRSFSSTLKAYFYLYYGTFQIIFVMDAVVHTLLSRVAQNNNRCLPVCGNVSVKKADATL